MNYIDLTQWAFDINVLYLCKKKNFKIKEIPTIWEDKKYSKIDKLGKISFQMLSGVVRLRIIYSPFNKLLTPFRSLVHTIHSITE